MNKWAKFCLVGSWMLWVRNWQLCPHVFRMFYLCVSQTNIEVTYERTTPFWIQRIWNCSSIVRLAYVKIVLLQWNLCYLHWYTNFPWVAITIFLVSLSRPHCSFMGMMISHDMLLGRWRLSLELFGRVFMEDVGAEPGSVRHVLNT